MNYIFAIPLPSEARQIIAEQADAWCSVLSLKPLVQSHSRWYDATAYHITLKFLGDLPESDEDELVRRGIAVAE